MPRRAIAAVPLLAALACREDATAPTDPSSTPAAAVAAAGPVWTQVTVGAMHTCALASNGRAYCWGYAAAGRLGTGTTAISQPRPTRIPGTLQFAQISAGFEHTCGVTTTNKAYCWGENNSGQLGDGTFTPRPGPVPVAGGRSFSRIRAGAGHTCATTPTGKAFCWGSNFYGELGNGTTTSRPTPGAVSGGLTFRRIMVGGLHTCGVATNDKAYCWGRGVEGQLGRGNMKNSSTPALVSGGLAWQAILPGSDHTCGITTAGKAYCWGTRGTDTYNGLGAGSAGELGTLSPVPVAGTRSWLQLTAGFLHTCGVTMANVPFCWGFNSRGQNGDGTDDATSVPSRVVGTLKLTGVATGIQRTGRLESGDAQHSCGITADGHIWCWGWNLYGQLGNGKQFPEQPNSLVPVATLMPS